MKTKLYDKFKFIRLLKNWELLTVPLLSAGLPLFLLNLNILGKISLLLLPLTRPWVGYRSKIDMSNTFITTWWR